MHPITTRSRRHRDAGGVLASSVAVALCLSLLACAPDAGDPVATTSDVAQPPAAPPSDAETGLPPGHPPIDGQSPADAIVPPPPGSGTGAGALTWTAPTHWIEETPASRMRRAQYRVPGAGGDGELVVFYFGPGQGGDAMTNAERWADQFTQPDGSSSRDVLQVKQIEVGGLAVLLTEVTGTYAGGMAMMGGPGEDLPSQMLLGAIATGPDANWFFKFTGPEATVQAERDAFVELVQSLAPGGSTT